MAKRRSFSQLSERSRRIAINAGSRWGLTSQETTQRYDAGTFNPFARGRPSLRVPAEYRGAVAEDERGQIVVNWRRAAELNYHNRLGPGSPKGETYKYNPDMVEENTREMSEFVARLVALASEDDLRGWASPQPLPSGEAPPFEQFVQNGFPASAGGGLGMEDVSYYDRGGSWINIFWYH